MITHIIDGKSIASLLKEDIKKQISDNNLKPGLAVILVGEDPASQVYVRSKIKACEQVGIKSFEAKLPQDSSAEDVFEKIEEFNNNPDIHGILLQLPLPDHIDSSPLIQSIDPQKDVDGLTYTNIGKLVSGNGNGFIPCTPQGSLKLIKSVEEDLTGKHAVVIGRSLLFGKPMGQLLLEQNCTLVQAHSRTKNLQDICKDADILVAAAGRPKMVEGDWIKKGAIVIDVGINRLEDGSLCGDVNFEQAKEHASAITPVPGGVGPMTIACLLNNTLYSALKNTT